MLRINGRSILNTGLCYEDSFLRLIFGRDAQSTLLEYWSMSGFISRQTFPPSRQDGMGFGGYYQPQCGWLISSCASGTRAMNSGTKAKRLRQDFDPARFLYSSANPPIRSPVIP